MGDFQRTGYNIVIVNGSKRKPLILMWPIVFGSVYRNSMLDVFDRKAHERRRITIVSVHRYRCFSMDRMGINGF